METIISLMVFFLGLTLLATSIFLIILLIGLILELLCINTSKVEALIPLIGIITLILIIIIVILAGIYVFNSLII